MPARDTVLVTCEHAVNRIPRRYAGYFTAAGANLAGHEGLDLGALWAARRLARSLSAPMVAAEASRLLVDLNRSCGHPRLFSQYSARLSDEEKRVVLARYYHPYRDRVEAWIRKTIGDGGSVLHVSVHSFVPVLRGSERSADIGLLYDPSRERERSLCREWGSAVRRHVHGCRVRFNYPYRGAADGFTKHLRNRFPERSYRGVEVEFNQAWLIKKGSARDAMVRAVVEGLIEASALVL